MTTAICPGCGGEVPRLGYCIRCGHWLPESSEAAPTEHQRSFAAAPHEHRLEPRVISTLFPHLPRADAKLFGVELSIGVALLASLTLTGLFPVALITAAVLVPLLVVVYFWHVDLYEDEPLRVLALTIVWGAAAGVGFGFIAKAVQSADAGIVAKTSAHSVTWNGVLLPLVGLLLVLVGPLILLPYRRFNDVLDGTTFGGASAVAFAGAFILTRSTTFLAGGLSPVGDVTQWVVRVLTLGIAVPVLAAATVGAACGSLWLRYRAPAKDRHALGPLGHPMLALPLAAVGLVGAALAQLYLDRWAALATLAALDAVALVWLRHVITVGLHEEASERTLGPELTCANCERRTPRHSFCGRCGIALAALPKTRRRRRSHVAFAGGLGLLVAAAALTLIAFRPTPPRPLCAKTRYCAGPPVAHAQVATVPPLVNEQIWRTSQGFQLEYDQSSWSAHTSTQNTTESISLTAQGRLAGADLQILVTVAPSGSGSPSAQLADERTSLQTLYPSLALDTEQNQPLGPSIGSVYGIGEADAGTTADESRPVEAMMEASNADGLTVLVAAWTDKPQALSGADSPFPVFVLVDQVLETARWPSEQTP
jgi:hypothetical protein